MDRAATSLPVPVSPSITTGASQAANFASRRIASRNAADLPLMLPSSYGALPSRVIAARSQLETSAPPSKSNATRDSTLTDAPLRGDETAPSIAARRASRQPADPLRQFREE